MTESEFLRRFDEHVVRFDEHLERSRVQTARIEEEMKLSREMHADLRAFTRDLTRRNELVFQGVMKELADLSDQTRANTDAVLQVLDRLNPPA